MPSSSTFPVSLDSFSDPTSTTRTDTGIPHGALHALENDAIAALEAKVGIDGSTDHASIDWKLGDARSRLTTVEADISTNASDITTEAAARAAADSTINSTLATKADLVSGKVPSSQLPAYVDDVVEYANFAGLPGTGSTGIIYVTLDTNYEYRWSGSTYVRLVASPGSTDDVAEGTTNLYFTAARVLAVVLTGISLATNAAITATDTILVALGKLQKQITDLITTVSGKVDNTTTVNGHALSSNVTVTKGDVGLGNCDNTSDANKPVSTAQAAADAAVASAAASDATTKANAAQAAAIASAQSYTDTAVIGLLEFKGTTNCSGNPNYPAANKGDAYIVSAAGKIGGASGTSVDIGDWYVAEADNAGGTEASVGSSWGHIEHNLVGALLASNNLSDLGNAGTARSNLGVPSGSGSSTGTNTGDQTNISGNAVTATALQTPRNINGQPFDGTADITIAAGGGSGGSISIYFA